jgi:superfamily I DNA and/or RNA helicase
MRNGGKFDIILIDEAGQVTEPDALIPLWQNVSETTVVIIVGDTKQLGPTVVSQNESVRKILGTSFMERIYAQNDQDTVSIDLTTQYRMNLEISQFISDTFYNSSIRSDTATSGTCLQLLKRKVSALCIDTSPFCDGMLRSIRGSSRLFLEERNQSSYRNNGEARLIRNIIVRLIAENKDLQTSAIAVITPYRDQKKNIVRELMNLDRKRFENIRVNTVDAFQGQEARVVIIDLVRSGGRSVGFIDDSRRINVALSRARDLAIVVGNRKTMKVKDTNLWTSWFDFCNNLSPSGVIHTVHDLEALYDLGV